MFHAGLDFDSLRSPNAQKRSQNTISDIDFVEMFGTIEKIEKSIFKNRDFILISVFCLFLWPALAGLKF